jgi:hypothetical protein
VPVENKLAKIDLLEQWPKRLRDIQAAIESGQARPIFDRIVSTSSEIEFLPRKDRIQVDSSAFRSVKREEEYRPTLRRQ